MFIMDSLHNFENVLRKLVVPMFPEIVDVSVEHERGLTHDVKVTYYLVHRMFYYDTSKVENETKSIFLLMGFEKVYTPWITYRLVKENNVGK